MALSVAQLYEVMAQLPDPVFILSEDGYYIEYIGGMEQQSYQNGNPLIGRQLLDVLPEDKAQWVMAQVAQALASGQVQVVEYDLSPAEVDGIDADAGPQGMQRFEGKIAPLPSLYEGKRAVAWMTRSITRQHELQQRLKRLGETDVSAQLRGEDLFVRSGGEEFLILLPQIDEGILLKVAERIRAAVAALAPDPAPVTVSLGTTLIRPGEDLGTVLARADEWLYRAKRGGRNRVAHAGDP